MAVLVNGLCFLHTLEDTTRGYIVTAAAHVYFSRFSIHGVAIFSATYESH